MMEYTPGLVVGGDEHSNRKRWLKALVALLMMSSLLISAGSPADAAAEKSTYWISADDRSCGADLHTGTDAATGKDMAFFRDYSWCDYAYLQIWHRAPSGNIYRSSRSTYQCHYVYNCATIKTSWTLVGAKGCIVKNEEVSCRTIWL